MQQETQADIYSTEDRDKDFELNTEQYGPQREKRKPTASEIQRVNSGKRRRGRERKGNLKEKGKRRKRLET